MGQARAPSFGFAFGMAPARSPASARALVVMAALSCFPGMAGQGASSALAQVPDQTAASTTVGVPVRPVAFRADPISPEFGRPFDLHVTLRVAPGTLLLLPDTLVPGEASQSAGVGRWRTEAAAGDSLDVLATYPVMGLANGEVELPTLEAAVRSAEDGVVAGVERRSGDSDAPSFSLRIGRIQVIPHRAIAEAEGQPQPRPPADVVGRNWSAWAVLAGVVAIALAGLLAFYGVGVWRRAAQARRTSGLRMLPRRDALDALARLRGLGWHREGRIEPFYQEVSRIFRGFAARAQPSWGEDLTSTELATRISERERSDAARELWPSVISGEGVRFGAQRPTGEVAEAHVDVVARWIESTDAAPPEEGGR